MSSIECDFLCVGDESGVDVPQPTVPVCLFGHQLPERWSHQTQHSRRHGNGREADYPWVGRVLPSFSRYSGEGHSHQNQIEDGFTHVGIDVGDGSRECLQVFGEGVIGIGQSSVEVTDPIVGLVSEVEGVGVVYEACANGER